MSIATELQQLAANKAAIKAAIEAKNPETAPTNDMSQWPTAIESIPEGGGGEKTVAITGAVDSSDDNLSLRVDGVQKPYNNIYPFADSITLSSDDVGSYTLHYADGTTQDGGLTYENNCTAVLHPDQSLYITWFVQCLLRGTLVALANGTEKPIEDITYGDELLCWDFDRCRRIPAHPLWIARKGDSDYAFVCEFASGRKLRITGKSATGWGHRGFNVTRSSFTYFPASVGDMFSLIDGVDELVKCERVKGEFDYYNIITEGHFNLYADGVLTSCHLNNYREFSGKDLRFTSKAVAYHDRSEFEGIPDAYIDGLHLCEQPEDVDKLKTYVRNLLSKAVNRMVPVE